MKVFWSPLHARHVPEMFIFRGNIKQHHERPERVEVLLSAALAAGFEAICVEPDPDTLQQSLSPNLTETHDRAYIDFVLNAHAEWSRLPGAGPEIIPGIRPQPPTDAHPLDIAGQSGRFMGDMASPIGAGTAVAALSAVAVAEAAAQSILSSGPHIAYALCRPCGHHNTRGVAGGGCYFNNIATAVHDLRRTVGRIAVLDIDAHHGNGTQAHFYDRADALTVSVHADPNHFYPFYWGYEDEHGAGKGEGYNRNLPVPVGADDDTWMVAVEAGCDLVRDHAPDVLVVALGQDPHIDDPLKGMKITNDGFARAGHRIHQLGLPTLVVQEGGYLSPQLGNATERFLNGLQGS